MVLLFFISSVLLLSGSATPLNVCDLPMSPGSSSCFNQPSHRFYFDSERHRCLSFQFTGCGGNENNFVDYRTCHQRCIPQDSLVCPANTPPMKNINGSSNCNGDLAEVKCEAKSHCHKGVHGHGLCCSNEAKEKAHEDHSLTCSNGKKKFTIKAQGNNRIFVRFGKDCSTNFCDSGYKCTQGNYFSFCCEL